MPRIEEITEDGGDPILTSELASERKMFGDVLNPTRAMAHCPAILRAAKKLYASIDESGLLPVNLLALAYARVAALNGCPF
jgi:alkylhydroperoxidase family enzyme